MIPEELYYTESHEWVRFDKGVAVVGITHFAQDQLGDITFVELPQEGDSLSAKEEMGSIESVKAASELYAPLSGTVTEVNAVLDDEPELVNSDPYGQGWMLKVTPEASEDEIKASLLDAKAYAEIAQAHD